LHRERHDAGRAPEEIFTNVDGRLFHFF
jgi:hypothetical protein